MLCPTIPASAFRLREKKSYEKIADGSQAAPSAFGEKLVPRNNGTTLQATDLVTIPPSRSAATDRIAILFPIAVRLTALALF
jgi:hypothetical protein